jgi:hypothetical protein
MPQSDHSCSAGPLIQLSADWPIARGPEFWAADLEPPVGIEPTTYALRERILAC